MANARKSYKRVLLKLSGEVFGGEKGVGQGGNGGFFWKYIDS